MYKTIPSSVGEVAALPNLQKQMQKEKQNGETGKYDPKERTIKNPEKT